MASFFFKNFNDSHEVLRQYLFSLALNSKRYSFSPCNVAKRKHTKPDSGNDGIMDDNSMGIMPYSFPICQRVKFKSRRRNMINKTHRCIKCKENTKCTCKTTETKISEPFESINTKLRRIFYSRRTWRCFDFGYNDIRKDKRLLCKTIEHCFACLPFGRCSCGITLFEPDSYVTHLIKFLLQANLIIDHSNLVFDYSKASVRVCVDFLGHVKNVPSELVKIVLKIGNGLKNIKTDNLTITFDNMLPPKIGCSTVNIHQLQNAVQDMILEEEYGIKVHTSFVLYIYPARTIGGFKTLECERVDSPKWLSDQARRKELFTKFKSYKDTE